MKAFRHLIYPLLYFTWVAISAANEVLPVVAVAEFNTRLETHESLLMARNLASQAQAALTNSNSLRLVERSQLELAANELDLGPYHTRSTRGSLAVGRWVGADFIMLGTLDRSTEGLWVIGLEVVDTVEADVLAEATVSLTSRPDQQPEIDSSMFMPIGTRLIEEALAAQALNREANLVLTPLFFDYTGKLRNLEPLKEKFFRQLQAQTITKKGVRLLQFPRVQQVQHEMELRLDGLTEMTRHRPTRNPVFFWGDIEEVESEGIQPEEVLLRAHVSIRTNSGEPREITVSNKSSQTHELMSELVRLVIDTAKQLSQAPVTAPDPNTTEAEKLRAHAQRLHNEFSIRRESGEPIDSQRRLGNHIDSLYQLAAFFSPDDVSLKREHLTNRYVLLHPDNSLDFYTYLEINRNWMWFDKRFPGQHTIESLNRASHFTLVLLDSKRRMRKSPQDWPPELWRQLKAELQKQIIERMKEAGPEAMRENTNFANYIHYNVAFEDTEKRAEFVEMLWPNFIAHSVKFRDDLQDWSQWEKVLQEIFSAVGRPERAKSLAALRNSAVRRESGFPQDLRFMVRRPDILPPELDHAHLLIASDDPHFFIDVLHYDGTNLWVGAQKGQRSFTNQKWRQRMVEKSASNKLYRLKPGSVALEDISNNLDLPSKICTLTTDKKHLWAGTQMHGILQIERVRGALIRKWDISTGLPTRNIYALDANENSVIAGGGDLHRGYLFEISDAKEGAVNLAFPGWREDIAPWRAQDIPKSQFGEVSILLHAHGRRLAVASGAQAILWGNGTEISLNLTDSVLGGESRFGRSAQNGTVIAATQNMQGWWLGTDAGLALLSPDGTPLRRWNTPIGGYFFEQKEWVPFMRSSGELLRNFDYNTRLVGAVTALAADGDFLFVAVSTEVDHYLPSPLEGAHLYVMHIPSGKWLGRVKLPARATAMAQDETRLWIGYAGPSAALLQFTKSELTNLPSEYHVADLPSAEELETAIGKLSIKERACHAFFKRDYQRVVDLLGELTIETASVGELFLIAFSNDKSGLARADVARVCFEEILRRQTHSFWREEAQQGLKALE